MSFKILFGGVSKLHVFLMGVNVVKHHDRSPSNRGESLPSSDGFPSLPLSLVVPVIRADLQ